MVGGAEGLAVAVGEGFGEMFGSNNGGGIQIGDGLGDFDGFEI